MVDIHCHYLPGVDDGPRTPEEAKEMVEMAAADGITDLVATPHCNARYEFSLERNQALLRQLSALRTGTPQLYCGCDLHLSYENLERVLTDPQPFTLNQRSYLLVEFAEAGIAPRMADMLHRLRVRALIPIVTHPERNPLLSENNFRFLRQLVEMGCPIQVTANSLTGRFGFRVREMVKRLFETQLVHFVATDAHDLSSRPPKLSEAREVVAGRWGEEVARAVFVDNPGAVIEGRPLPYFPEPAPIKRRKRFTLF